MTDILHGIKVDKKIRLVKGKLGQKDRLVSGFRGYAGLTHTAAEISDFIPKSKLFVEPFAGLGRISKRVKADKIVMNDLSDYAVTYLQKNFHDVTITQVDYLKCIERWDSKDTLFFIDPPWLDEAYDLNPLPAYTEPAFTTYNKLQSLLPKIKGNWIVAGKVNGGPLLKWGWEHKLITSRKNAIFGQKAKTYLVSNMKFVRHNQEVLF